MKLKRYGQTYDVEPMFGMYGNDRLAMQLVEPDLSVFGTVTVNLVDEQLTDDLCAFIDTNNLGEDIVLWLERNGLGETTNNFGQSGFCVYPEFRFKKEVVAKYSPQ